METAANNSSYSGNYTFEYTYDSTGRTCEPASKILTFGLYSLMFFISFISNLLVLLVIVLNRPLRTGSNVLILGLAAGDILYSTSGMMFTPISLLQEGWIIGELFCVFIQMSAGVCVHAISYTTMCIALDRIRTVSSRKSLSITMATFITLVVWVSAALFSLPMALKTNVSNNQCVELWHDQETTVRYVYSLLHLFAPFVIPAIVITVCHVRMTKFFNHRYRFARARAQSGERRQIMRHLRRKRRASMLSLSIIICFILFFTPLNIFNLVTEFYVDLIEASPNSCTIYIACHLLTSACTVANPILFCCFNANFRRVGGAQIVFNRMFRTRRARQHQHQSVRVNESTCI